MVLTEKGKRHWFYSSKLYDALLAQLMGLRGCQKGNGKHIGQRPAPLPLHTHTHTQGSVDNIVVVVPWLMAIVTVVQIMQWKSFKMQTK